MELENKVALITGAKRIGLVVATALAHRGVDIALSYARSRAEAEAGAGAAQAAGRRGEIFKTNLATPADCRGLVASTVQALGGIDILIHMASVYRERSFDELSVED